MERTVDASCGEMKFALQQACEVLSEDEIRTILQPVARKLSQLVKSREISQSDGIAVGERP